MKLPGGPWESVFSSTEPDVEVHFETNEESEFLIRIIEKKDGAITGTLMQLFKVYVSDKDPGTLLEKFPVPALVFGIHPNGSETNWFLFLDSQSEYVTGNDESVSSGFLALKRRIADSENKIEPILHTMDHKLVVFNKASSQTREALLSSMVLAPLLVSRPTKTIEPVPSSSAEGIMRFGEAKLGKNKEGTMVHEPLVLFKKTMVLGGSDNDRLEALRILIESVLLSGSSAVIADFKNSFSGLREQNPNAKAVSASGFDLTPIGFPTEDFDVPNKVWVNFSELDMESVLELFRVGKTPSAKILKMVSELGVAANWSQLIDTIRIQSPGGDVTRFHLNKAMRIAALIDNIYSGFFNGPNNISTIAKSPDTGIGKAALLRFDGVDNRMRLILFHSLIREIKHFYEHVPKPQPISCMVFVPQARELFPYHQYWQIQRIIEDDLAEMTNFGVGICLATEKGMDLHESIAPKMACEFGIVSGRDVGVRMEKRKPYRVTLRPPVSKTA